MDHTPRALFAMVKAGMENQVLSSNTPWFCVSCYYCTVRCPQEVHVTDLMYTLKRFSIQEGHFRESSSADAPPFSQTFIDFVENYGRSFELGLATWYHLRYHTLDMPKIMPMALGLLRKGRIDITPKKIKDMDSLKAILSKAKELEGVI
jgi:heterodisulfide reductase subunit C